MNNFGNIMSKKPFEISRGQNGSPCRAVVPKPSFKQRRFEPKAVKLSDGRSAASNDRASTCRNNWHLSAIAIAKAGEDQLVMGEFANDADSSLFW